MQKQLSRNRKFQLKTTENPLLKFDSVITQNNDYKTNIWGVSTKNEFHYSVKDFKKINLRIYPNPVSTFIYLDYRGNGQEAYFEIYNLRRQKLISEKVLNKKTINVQGLNPGLYLYNFYIDGKSQSGQLIRSSFK